MAATLVAGTVGSFLTIQPAFAYNMNKPVQQDNTYKKAVDPQDNKRNDYGDNGDGNNNGNTDTGQQNDQNQIISGIDNNGAQEAGNTICTHPRDNCIGEGLPSVIGAQGPPGPKGDTGPPRTLKVTAREGQLTRVPPGQSASTIVVCMTDEQATGGGYRVDPDVNVTQSFPVVVGGNNRGWSILGFNEGTNLNAFMIVSAECTKLVP